MVVGDKVVVYSAICISQLLENRAKSNETATKKKPTTLGIPSRSPMQVLTEPDIA